MRVVGLRRTHTVGRAGRRLVSAVSMVVLTLAVAGGACSQPARPTRPLSADQKIVDLLACPKLEKGAEGDCVRELRRVLVVRGAVIEDIGVFGPKTANAVREFKDGRGLASNSIVDTETKNSLYDLPPEEGGWDLRTQCVNLSYGANGECVRTLQRMLTENGSAVPETGRFFKQTLQAVLDFQQHNKVRTTGVAGPLTKKALYKSPNLPVWLPVVGSGKADCDGILLGAGVRCDVYITRARTRAYADLLEQHPDEVAFAKEIIVNVGAAACSLSAAAVLGLETGGAAILVVGAGCRLLFGFAVRYVVNAVMAAARDGQCLVVKVLGTAIFGFVAMRLSSTNDPRFCR